MLSDGYALVVRGAESEGMWEHVPSTPEELPDTYLSNKPCVASLRYICIVRHSSTGGAPRHKYILCTLAGGYKPTL